MRRRQAFFCAALFLLLRGQVLALLFDDAEVRRQAEMVRRGGRVFLIINADDFGVTGGTNRGVIEVLERGIATSATIMMPTPGVGEVAEWAAKEPRADVGLHLTLNSEWDDLPWGPVSPPAQVPSLIDPQTGFLWADTPKLLARAQPGEVAQEVEAQIDLAKKMGIPVTHLDCHMGWCHLSEKLFEVYRQAGLDHRLPLRVASPSRRDRLREAGLWVPDQLNFTVNGQALPDLKESFIAYLKGLSEGVHEVLFHPAQADEELRSVMGSWRVRDDNRRLLLDDDVRSVIESEGIVLIGFSALHLLTQKTLAKEAP